MKSTDKFVLVLVASLALLLAGCGGGSSSTAPPVDPGPTAAEQAIMDAKAALTTAQAGMSSAMTDAEMLAAYQAIERAANNLVMVLKANNGSLADVEMATTVRQNAMNMVSNLEMKIADAQAAADKAMMAMATKLYMALGANPLAQNNSAASGTNVDAGTGALTVLSFMDTTTAGTFTDVGPTAALKEDKTAMVAPLHGWVGSMHTGESDTGTFTAQMYSNVGEPTPGAKINTITGFSGEVVTITVADTGSGLTNDPTRIASPEFTHSAGTVTLKLPDPNPNGQDTFVRKGSYYGVAGEYSCDTSDGANTCSVTKAAEGYTLGGTGTWTFKPSDPNARVTATPDDVYAVYGWWLHETEDGATVSAFTSYRGDATLATEAAAIADLDGTATYRGGAAGKYTVRAGAVNDAGHFTADAELMATFNGTGTADDHMITGTINNFMGSDGMARDWSVALKQATLTDTGVITPVTTGGTTWTMGGTAGSASGQWSGNLYQEVDNVPTVGTGTFQSEYGNIGRMVGAFGVNLEE